MTDIGRRKRELKTNRHKKRRKKETYMHRKRREIEGQTDTMQGKRKTVGQSIIGGRKKD